ncbi:hypothetical protein [Methylovulum miyakonense]|uniref:hypothetical protein n=1 Tax=Methylovulum miyakonense TaxID=645578 RepID=UPI00037B4684|nr:hypothetical protein [Methylovulum miyakonense]
MNTFQDVLNSKPLLYVLSQQLIDDIALMDDEEQLCAIEAVIAEIKNMQALLTAYRNTKPGDMQAFMTAYHNAKQGGS